MLTRGRCTAALFIIVVVASIGVAMAGTDRSSAKGPGVVYVMTNEPANGVAVFKVGMGGALMAQGVVPTGGAGDPGPSGTTDPLGSQGALVLSESGRWLFAVNAGSNDISVFAASPGGGLRLTDRIASGGTRPVGLTAHEDLVYVLNAGGDPGITGFRLDDEGRLAPIPDSTRALSGGSAAGPAQVQFAPEGDLLVVTEKGTSVIDLFAMDTTGRPGPAVAHDSHGMTPFGFDFSPQGTLVVSEAFGGAPGQAAVSSYWASPDGDLTSVSGSVPDNQTAACWVVVGSGGRFAYASNTGTGAVSSYQLRQGTVTLLQSAAGETGPGTLPTDMALSRNGKFLYVLTPGNQGLAAFRVAPDGSLMPMPGATGVPVSAQGIAAR